MRSRSMFKTGGAALAAAALGLSFAAPANADIAPGGSDIVGVGSDTLQNITNFMADGDPGLNAVGVNGAGGKNRVFSFDATPDANDRAGYLNGSTSAAPKPLNPTVVLRAATRPIQRPNGSGAGIKALIADTTAVKKLQFVRSSRLPDAAEHGKVGVSGMHVVKVSTDNLKMATATTTNAPASLTIEQVVSIFKCDTTNWNQISGGTAGVIIPLMPQLDSGTSKSFATDMQAGNGGTAVTLGSCVRFSEEHDPAAITSITGTESPSNAVMPFSEGRLNLYNGGYFRNPATVFPGAATPVVAGVKLLGGYVNNRGLYILFRESDLDSPKKWQPGSALNYARALFANPGGTALPYAASGDAALAIVAGGATPAYVDCGAGAGVTTC